MASSTAYCSTVHTRDVTFDDEFLPLSPLAPQSPNFALQILLFRLKHTVPVVTHAHVLQGFYITDVYGALLAKNNV